MGREYGFGARGEQGGQPHSLLLSLAQTDFPCSSSEQGGQGVVRGSAELKKSVFYKLVEQCLDYPQGLRL